MATAERIVAIVRYCQMDVMNCDPAGYMKTRKNCTIRKSATSNTGIAENVNPPLSKGLCLDNSSFSCIMCYGEPVEVRNRPSPYRRDVPGLCTALLPTEANDARSKQSASEGSGEPLLQSVRPDESVVSVGVVLPGQAAEAVWGLVMLRCKRVQTARTVFLHRDSACPASNGSILK